MLLPEQRSNYGTWRDRQRGRVVCPPAGAGRSGATNKEAAMADTNGFGTDLIDLLLEDHKAAEALLAKVGQSGEDQSALFDELVHDLVGHEVAEEEIVYPAVRSLPEGDAVAAPRIVEQQKAEELLTKMEEMDRSSAEFADSLAHLRDEATAHAKAEEAEVFPLLRQNLTEDR